MQFQKINDDKGIFDSDEFLDLIQVVVPNTKAAIMLERFLTTAANDRQGMNQIKERLCREDLLSKIQL